MSAVDSAQQVTQAAQAAAEATAQASTQAAHSAAAVWPNVPGHWPAQADLLTWAQNMGALTAAALVLAGAIYLLFGVTLYRGLVTANAALLGVWIGAFLGGKAGNATAGGMVGGFTAAAAAWPMMKYAVAIMGGAFGALLGASIWRATGLEPAYAWSGGLTGLVFFGMLSFLVFRGSVMMFMSLQGSVMLVFGLLGLIYKYQNLGPQVTANLNARQFILPLCIFVPATLGLIWQQTQYPAAGAAPTKK